MLSFSKHEFRIVGFLVRHLSARFTIRDIASKLSISAPGCHAALKKLEKNGIVTAEKLGHLAHKKISAGHGKDEYGSDALDVVQAKYAEYKSKTVVDAELRNLFQQIKNVRKGSRYVPLIVDGVYNGFNKCIINIDS